MIVKGKLITCKRETKIFKEKEVKEKLYLTLAEVELSEKKMAELKDAFKDSGKNFTPEWIKKFSGYINLATEFATPCKDLEGNEHESIEDFIKESKFPWMGAEAKIALNLKDGAVYPVSVVFLTEGKPFDPFAEFENDDED